MATNRGAYDPRQFLHYPDKNPFSDESQKRLDNLIQDFLRTGIAFANGASVHDLTLEEQRENAELPYRSNALPELEEEPSPEALEDDDAGEGEYDEYEAKLRRVDKGKGRDEREGPGLQGLWARTNILTSLASPPRGISDDDAISLSSGSGSSGIFQDEAEPEDGEGSYEEEYYENKSLELGSNEDDRDEYQEESSESCAELEPIKSSAHSSDQEIVYVGDSDEDEPIYRADFDIEAEERFDFHSGLTHMEGRGDQHENASDSQPDEAEEQGAQHDVWYASNEEDDADGEEDEWQHRSQGRESDEGPSSEDGEQDGGDERETQQMEEAVTKFTPRRFFTSAPLSDPWASLGSGDGSKSPPLAATTSRHQSHQTNQLENNPKGDEEDANPDEEIAPDVFKSPAPVPHELRSDVQADAEANGLGRFQELGQSVTENTCSSPSAIPATDAATVEVSAQVLISDPGTTISVTAQELTVSTQGRDDAIHTVDGDEAGANLQRLGPTELHNDDVIPAPDTVASGETFSTRQDFASLFPVADGTSAPSFSTYLPSPLPLAHSGKLLNFFDMMPPAEFPTTDISHLHDPSDKQELIPVPETGSSRPNGPGIAHVEAEEELLFDDSTASSGPPTEPILHDATFSRVSDVLRTQVGQFEATTEGFQDSISLRPLPSSVVTTRLAEDPSNMLQEVQSAIGDDQFVSGDLPETAGETSLLTEGGDEDNDDHQLTSTALHPAVFGNNERHIVDAKHRSPSPFFKARTGRISPGLECHSVAEPHGDGLIHEPYTLVEAHSENDKDVGRQELDVEAVPWRDPSATGGTSPDHAVAEIISQDGRGGTASSQDDNHFLQQGRMDKPTAPAIPAISVGSNTPPLSPTATVTNCSSAPDPSVATSDLSTVNPATVSVVTSTSSPPPIHVSRPSPHPTDIYQPQGSRVGFTSDEDGEDATVFPDPRLPPEPTHLRIPVGVLSRGLADDKQETAESMKVEPPTPHVTSESEDSSVTDIGEIPDGERPLQGIEVEVATEDKKADPEASLEFGKLVESHEERVSTVSNEPLANNDKEVDQVDAERESPLLELTYPDSDSDHPSKLRRGGSISFTDQPFGSSEGGERSHTPRPADHDLRSSLHLLSPVSEDAPSMIPKDDEIRRGLSVNGSPVLTEKAQAVDTNGHTGRIHNGNETKEFIRSPDPTRLDVVPVVPVVIEGGSSNNVKHSPRSPISTKGKAKGKGKATRSLEHRSESPPPQSTIRVQGRGSAASRKRPRASDAAIEPSKQRRLTRSAATGHSTTLSFSDNASVSAVSDDKSDISSIASSSSAVLRIIIPKRSKPSSSIPSRSPSIVSQSSPTSAMGPPIRPYVPHNHNQHTLAPPVSTTSPRRRTTPVSHRGISESPSSSALSQTTSTHQTRASCTDHKISIPGPNGPLYFLIPRCTLLDPEVEKDDSIVDCGVATKEEVQRAVGDLEAVGLDLTILGVIRQLAGVQLMREGQVGYLPKPGERVLPRVKQRRSHVRRPSFTPPQVDPVGPSGDRSSHPASLDHEATASPASSSVSSICRGDKTEDMSSHRESRSKGFNADHAGYEPTLDDRDEGGEDNEHDDRIVTPPGPRSPKLDRLTKPTRSRRRGLRTEDAAYKPENDDVDSSSDVESSGAKKKSKNSRKRRRSEASTQGENLSASALESDASPTKKQRRRDAELLASHDESREEVSKLRHKKSKQKTTVPHKSDSLNPLV